MRLNLVFLCTLGAVTAPAVLHAQWLNFPAPGTPRGRDGKPNLSAPAPRTGGKPDLSGVWHVQPTPIADMKRIYGEGVGDLNVPGMEADTISRYGINLLGDFKPAESPMRPAAAALWKARAGSDIPSSGCLPLGVPLNALLSEPIKIIQSPRLLAVLYEAEDKYRQVYLDGRTLPKQFDQPAWVGYSVGKWDHDTLVVESAGFNDKSPLDLMGHPHSEALHITERYHRRDFGHMDVQITFDDAPMYTKPFTVKLVFELWPESDIFEYVCTENEKDRAHGPGK